MLQINIPFWIARTVATAEWHRRPWRLAPGASDTPCWSLDFDMPPFGSIWEVLIGDSTTKISENIGTFDWSFKNWRFEMWSLNNWLCGVISLIDAYRFSVVNPLQARCLVHRILPELCPHAWYCLNLSSFLDHPCSSRTKKPFRNTPRSFLSTRDMWSLSCRYPFFLRNRKTTHCCRVTFFEPLWRRGQVQT